MNFISTWLINRKQRKVARRLAYLKIKIAEAEEKAVGFEKLAKLTIFDMEDREAIKHRAIAAGLKVKLAHNLQHEDNL